MIVSFLITFYLLYFFEMLTNKKQREGVQNRNEKLNTMRKIPVKTLEEQKQFLNLKYPKPPKAKFVWSKIFIIIGKLLLFIVVFRTVIYGFDYFGVVFAIWQAILFIIVFPIIVNIILSKFNLQKEDIRVYMK